MGDKEVVLPDYLKAMLDDGSAAVCTEMISSADSVPRISLKQSRFRFKKDGDEVKTRRGRWSRIRTNGCLACRHPRLVSVLNRLGVAARAPGLGGHRCCPRICADSGGSQQQVS